MRPIPTHNMTALLCHVGTPVQRRTILRLFQLLAAAEGAFADFRTALAFEDDVRQAHAVAEGVVADLLHALRHAHLPEITIVVKGIFPDALDTFRDDKQIAVRLLESPVQIKQSFRNIPKSSRQLDSFQFIAVPKSPSTQISHSASFIPTKTSRLFLL